MDQEKTQAEEVLRPSWRTRLNALRNIPPVMRFVWEAAPKLVVSILVLRTLAAIAPLSMLAVTKIIIDSINGYSVYHKALPSSFWWLVLLEFALAGLTTILMRLVDFCDGTLGDKFTRHISIRLMEHAANLDLAAYEDPVFYDKLERARVQSTDRVQMIQYVGRFFQEVATVAIFGASIFLFSPWVLLALVAFVVPAFLGETHFAFLSYSLNFKQTPARRELEYLRVLGGTKESAKELKLFGLGPFLTGRYSDLSDKLFGQTLGLSRRRLLIGSLLALLGMAGYYGTYAFVIYRTIAGVLTLGTLIFLTGAIAGASANIQAVFTTFSIIANQAMFVSDLLQFFSETPKIVSKPGALQVPQRIRTGFEFKNVSFKYPGSSRLILKDVSFRIAPSERIAIVGGNGQGKTTIVKLLTHLYEPTSGQVLLDGTDLREFDMESLWKEIGVIFQDFMRYEMTAAANIAVGRIEERNNPFRIRTAARKSLADSAIRNLPKGFDQMLGSRFEGAIDLSGGEWQRIALARAYLRDAQLLILDEPTAALDAPSEHEVFQRFAELTKGKMSLLISHRFSTVRMADRILVLDDGRIAEEGMHDELLDNGGRYAEMFELQAAAYR